MPAMAEAGFHAVAPDQRGYGRTTGWSADFDPDLRPWRTLNAVRDALGLVAPRPADQFGCLAIEVTAPADPFRIRRQPMLANTTRLSCDDPCSTRVINAEDGQHLTDRPPRSPVSSRLHRGARLNGATT